MFEAELPSTIEQNRQCTTGESSGARNLTWHFRQLSQIKCAEVALIRFRDWRPSSALNQRERESVKYFLEG